MQDPEISDILVNTYDAGLHRAARPAGADRRPLPGRPAPAPGDRPDRVGRRPPDRRLLADGGRAPAGRLARQRHHQAAGDRRPAPLDPQVQARRAVGARTCSATRALTEPMLELLSGHRARRGSTSSSRAAPAPARRRCSTSCRRSSRPTSGSSPSRTRPSSSSGSRTSCGWRPGRPTSRARARCRSACCSSTPCVCGRTASSWASAAAPRRWTCCRR